jgi:hypothetical protein
MPENTVAQKARVKPGTTIAFVKPAKAELVFLFARTRSELAKHLPAVVGALAPGSAVWVFFRKGSREAGLDMNRDTVWAAAEKLGLRPLGLVSVDESWSAFRLRPAR